MSLNRSEQQVCDYVMANPEEHRFWEEKVKRVVREEGDRHRAAAELAELLQAYSTERAAVVPELRDCLDDGSGRVPSMRNLSEYWLRLWAPPPPKKKRESSSW